MTEPILFSFPDRFETKNLLLRLPLPGDGIEVNLAKIESLEELKPWMSWAQSIPLEEQTEANVRSAHIDFLRRADLRFHGYHHKTNELVICCGLHRIDWIARKFEIGYWVRTKYSRQGFVTEAVKGLEDFAITHLQANRLEIRCDKENERSVKVAKRLGYTMEGVLRKEALDTKYSLRDTIVFAKIRDVEFFEE